MRYFILLLSLSFFSCYAQSKDCSKFKTGTFKYINSDKLGTIITRNDSIQIETNTKRGVEMTGKIKWLSDCKYKLTYIKISNSDYNRLLGTSFYVDITSVKDNAYTFKAYDETREMDGEIVRIE